MEEFDCWLPSWKEIHENIKEIGEKIKRDRYKPDVVIALSRGGFVPARVLCDLMIIKDLISVKVDHWGVTATKDGKAHLRFPIYVDLSGKNALIVDDVTDTGESMIIAKEFVKSLNPKEIRTATIFHIKGSRFIPDYYSREIDWIWVMWPWNYVEDMCNILPKVLDRRRVYSLEEIKEQLRRRFKIDLSEREIREILEDLVSRKVLMEKGPGWIKT